MSHKKGDGLNELSQVQTIFNIHAEIWDQQERLHLHRPVATFLTFLIFIVPPPFKEVNPFQSSHSHFAKNRRFPYLNNAVSNAYQKKVE